MRVSPVSTPTRAATGLCDDCDVTKRTRAQRAGRVVTLAVVAMIVLGAVIGMVSSVVGSGGSAPSQSQMDAATQRCAAFQQARFPHDQAGAVIVSGDGTVTCGVSRGIVKCGKNVAVPTRYYIVESDGSYRPAPGAPRCANTEPLSTPSP